ncbi:N-acetylmuramoyl-L-alanine amidase [Xanthobacter sp. DSM 24535]|uniref:N-acetylmuramoyl-L-alanine amidase n=1 Tax=Roseixanthobacter psychrophilus TaxID=3119917 RepID=UPI00372B9904
MTARDARPRRAEAAPAPRLRGHAPSVALLRARCAIAVVIVAAALAISSFGWAGPASAADPTALQIAARPDELPAPAASEQGLPNEPAAQGPAIPPGPAIATGARLAGDAQRTRLVIDLDRKVEFRAFTLANPYRVILDLPAVRFAFDASKGQTKRGLVNAYRYGEFAPGKARVVIDVGEPVAIDKAFILDAIDDQPARLVLDLVKTDAAHFTSTVATAAEARGAPAAMPVATDGVADGDTRPVICLDPGHGGIDSGTTGASAYSEKNIVLDVALALKAKLEASGKYRVVMTRSTDTFIALGERVRIARANRAALFVSIHADALASGDGQARGASVYTLSETASDAESAHLAEKENKADLIAGVDLSEESNEVAGILFDLAQRETKNFSALFARTLVGAMKGAGRIHKSPLKSAGFRVLKAHDVPSVLVEVGYMSSREDLKLMTSDAWREKVTDAMQSAINEFFATRVAGGNAVTPEPVATGSLPR